MNINFSRLRYVLGPRVSPTTIMDNVTLSCMHFQSNGFSGSSV